MWSIVARWETGEVALAIKYLPKFAEILGVSRRRFIEPKFGHRSPQKVRKSQTQHTL